VLSVTPEEHDEELLRLENHQRDAERKAAMAERIYRVSLGQRRRGGEWQNLDGTPATLPVDASVEAVALLDAATGVSEARKAIQDHERAYTGWSRYRLVISSDGHVHANDSCRSFRPTTKTIVIPSLSGKDPKDSVDLLGNACCSVCMPSSGQTISKIPSSLVNVLVKRGTKAFETALARRKDLTRTTAWPIMNS
jgi:hypothetical protein